MRAFEERLLASSLPDSAKVLFLMSLEEETKEELGQVENMEEVLRGIMNSMKSIGMNLERSSYTVKKGSTKKKKRRK